MIVYLQGVLQQINDDHLVLLTHGVGYQVFISKNSLEKLPEPGTDIEIHTHTIVREDAHLLFGFLSLAEKNLFLKLIQVNSVGPKLALTILSGIPPDDFIQAVHREDLVQLTAIPGIGKKTAERIIVDLKDKLAQLVSNETIKTTANTAQSITSSAAEEALSALINLGYHRQEAWRALQQIPNAKDLPLEKLLKEGLKALS